MLFLYANGNLVHDANVGSHAPLSFATKAEGEAKADALYEADRQRALAKAGSRGLRFVTKRESYVVAERPPEVP